jgi:serine/threonine protein phosphatase PrpC
MPVHIKKYDTLLLATDGLFDNVEKETIIDIIRKGPLTQCCQTLARLASERMTDASNPYKPDDLTFILFRRTVR